MANQVIIDKQVCKGCALCILACPKSVIQIDRSTINDRGYNPATAGKIEFCVACGMCAVMCPDSAITVERE